ncbi:23S rRNA (uracil(1939)-C(5))-methyltransferase [Neisseria leonii]|uniref:23S rRNA (Uracil(1939)-C(5))-methyltransferase n=1 Tax=Neisseria leonii TaxID=2995413 RepID=A0A9X4IEX2_9NEIS|nr:23S rRNA (uracil(1939)-C(5))-methyltransferase [Neisseria sp. 51.81]MDD9328662.1 23S rRNA (uracil(1939)-C(5))-methyltransferase [Neisseria sp. 51.81]
MMKSGAFQTALTGEGRVSGIDQEGRGVVRGAGKTVFVAGALPSERAVYRIVRRHKGFDEAEAVSLSDVSPVRREPPCPQFGECGGCALQHIEDSAQVAFKQRIVEEQLWRIGRVRPQRWLPPIYGFARHYRQRGRLRAQWTENGLRLGFQTRRSHRVVAAGGCLVLPEAVARMLPLWQQLLGALLDKATLEGLLFAQGSRVLAWQIHTRRPLADAVRARLISALAAWQEETGTALQLWLSHGRGAAECVAGQAADLYYELRQYGIRMPFAPGDFTQVNAETNELMVARALALLNPAAGERIADLFCGLGNFTLPLAQSGAQVLAVEGLVSLTRRAQANACLNGLAGHIRFQTADLFACTAQTVAAWGHLDKMLIDPPRAGAYVLVQALPAGMPKRLVYVSCNPATFARDAAVLVRKGYVLEEAGVMNLFAQTAHVELVARFEYGG